MTGCPMLLSSDVEGSAAWYTRLLGADNVHPGEEFAMIMLDGQLVLLLHDRNIGEHPVLTAPGEEPPGAGVLLYFWVQDVDAAFTRARELGPVPVDEPRHNPEAGAREFSLRDPDGYAVTVSARVERG